MLNTTCIPCQHGDCEKCQGGQAAPKGMMGGWQCVCDHARKGVTVCPPDAQIPASVLEAAFKSMEDDGHAA